MNPETFIKKYEAALKSQKWEIVKPLMHNEVCVTFSTGAVHKGIAQVKQAYEQNFASIKNEQFLITNVHWVKQTEQFAVYLFDFKWQGLYQGKSIGGTGKGTTVLVNEEGNWKILTEQLGASK